MSDIDISIVDKVRKVGADFSFSNTLASNVNNVFFSEQLANIHADEANRKDNLVNVLSAIGDQLGSKMYEDILNYIDNVGNVDICKVQALQTMTKMLGISYTSFGVIDKMPQEIQNILDVMSITPEYLLMSDKVCSALAQITYSDTSSLVDVAYDVTQISTDLSGYANATIKNYIDVQKLDNLISSVYATQISSVLLSTYYDFHDDGTPIISNCIIFNNDDARPAYSTYSNYINNYHQILVRSADYDDKINRMKKFYNIQQFNEVEAVDNIQFGIKYESAYTDHEKEIIDIELQWRAKAYREGYPISRNAWYRANHVQQYVDFIEDMCTIDMLSSLNIYDIDNDYIRLDNNVLPAQLLKSENEIDFSMVNKVVRQLTIMTKYIRELRHKIKSQAQKNCMKGTFLFLSYIINEYLKDSVVANSEYFSQNLISNINQVQTDTQLIEYIDTTNYFNISTIVDGKAKYYNDPNNTLSSTLNPRFWENNSSMSVVVPSDNTDIFSKLNTVQSNGTAFSLAALSAFYINTLNNKFGDISACNDAIKQTSHLKSFLCAIFDTGADTTYMDADGKLSCYIDMSKYQEMLASIMHQIELQQLSAQQEKSIKEAEVTESISNMQISVQNDIDAMLESVNSQLLVEYQAVQDYMNNLQYKYDHGEITSALYNSMSATRHVDLQAKEDYFFNLSAGYESDKLTELCTYTESMSAEYDAFAAEQDAKVKELSVQLFNGLSTDQSAYISSILDYKKELFWRYSGLSSQELPFYYYSNTIHPSYQIHPYLSTFIEAYDYTYAIENMPLLAENTMFDLLKQQISSYIDNCGYLISVWNNPLNRNSDYLTHYERVQHLDYNNKDNCLYGYDGLFYPTAIHELLSIYKKQQPAATLADYEEFVSKWYSGLNISEVYQERIVQQLSGFSKQIQAAAGNWYDIYRYGTDIFGNMYILLKDYNLQPDENNTIDQLMQNVTEQQKASTPGSLWIRFKNHPIAFPAYYKTANLSVFQQVDYDKSTSNTVFQEYSVPRYADIPEISDDALLSNKLIPTIYDFFMSYDKQQIAMYAAVCSQNNPLSNVVVINGISQLYDYNQDVDRYTLYLTTIQQQQASKFEKDVLLSNEQFASFINYEYNIGYYSLLSVNNTNEMMDVVARQRIFADPSIQNYVTDDISATIIRQYNNTLQDIKVDSCNGKVYFAYIEKYADEQQKTLSCTYFNQLTGINYNDLSACGIQPFNDNMLVVVQANIGRYNINIESKKRYTPFTDMGFLPLASISSISKGYNDLGELTPDIKYANMSNTAFQMLEKYAIIKMQPISYPADLSSGISWLYAFPDARIYEDAKYNASALTSINPAYSAFQMLSSLSVYSYNELHSFEEASISNVNKLLVEPYEVREYLDQHQDVQLNIKVNEQYKLEPIMTSPYLARMIPWLIKSENVDQSIFDPGCQNDTSDHQDSNQATLFLVKGSEFNNIHPLSVSWYYLSDNCIKLDFNKKYFFKRINENLPNICNYQHTFLNLDYPGAAGYLKVYSSTISAAEKPEDFENTLNLDNVYYIKNISDTKPKFLLSAMYYGDPEYDMDLLNTTDIIKVQDTYEIEPLVIDAQIMAETTHLSILNIATTKNETDYT